MEGAVRGRDRALVLGCGNLLLSDEGFGVHLILEMERRDGVAEGVTLYDGGTAGIALAPVVEEHTHLVVVDAVAADRPPGTVLLFQGDGFWDRAAPLLRSSHQVGLLEVISICRLRGWRPKAMALVGLVPASVGPGVELSAEAAAALPRAVEAVDGLLCQWGFSG